MRGRRCSVDESKRWVWFSPKDMNACTCKDLAWLFNAQRGVKRPAGFPYCLEPRAYQDVTPVSRIMRRGCVAPPAMPLRTLLVNLWGDQPGSWAFELGAELEPAATPNAFEQIEIAVLLREGIWLSGAVDNGMD